MSVSNTPAVVSSRQALIEAAVAGTLTIQPQPATAKEGGRAVGKVTGLPSILAWAYRFAENERLLVAEKRSDDELLALMLADFPENESACFRKIAFQRAYYNSGKGTGSRKPKVQSTAKGEVHSDKKLAAKPENPVAKAIAAIAKPAAPKPATPPPAPVAPSAKAAPKRPSVAELKAKYEARKAASEKAALVTA